MREALLWGAAALLPLLAALLFLQGLRQRRRLRRLTEAIDAFLSGGEALPISTADTELGHLETNISELENRLLQEREATRQQARSNTEFISDISHQLKTPLAALRLYCEMEEGTEHREKKLTLIEKMEKLIQNVLTLEKLRSDGYELSFESCELGELTEAVFGELRPLFPEKRLSLTGSAALRGDPAWLREALGNTVKNACEHTRPGGSVSVRLEQGERSVSIEVEDDGGGVSPGELPLLFRRFHRAENAAPGSTGIGLAITRAVVEKHHGLISAANGPAGLIISITLPVIDAALKI